MGTDLKVSLDNRPAAKVEAEALITYVFEPEKEGGTPVEGVVAEIDQAAGGALGRLAEQRGTDRQIAGNDLGAFRPGHGRAARVAGGCGKAREIWHRGVAQAGVGRVALSEVALGEASRILGAGGGSRRGRRGSRDRRTDPRQFRRRQIPHRQEDRPGGIRGPGRL